MQADVRSAVGKCLADDDARHLGELSLGNSARRTEWPEVDLYAERSDCFYGCRHVQAGVSFVERFDRELQ